mmetsp:Transcript_27117/g.42138  ORF Transcript_27117/g.42138 Transcript_27117/m.42138 type:complete len:1271 (+) Transcript_27117:357-4169(+)|eukprot:CAMPEP_0196815250 /NCGR_PEP_ID=MMETSP1362-20130617/48623_1 /TAXON_ID=163516 /ORGANISM="Leptocylindrus danicus, Strain CCMP1856" /LENGTH=1270 /DNA_ID=CAMNT_0042192133 /DNA_START=262 /DNA_END=4074 /DNA_ORIENTATION=-
MTSFFSRLGTEMSNAISDAYGNFMYGDDAGKSAKLVHIIKPKDNKISIDMTFLEVNERAYVQTVERDGVAAQIGVQARDALQLAVIMSSGEANIPPEVYRSDEAMKEWALNSERKGRRTNYKELQTILKIGTHDGVVSSTGKKFFPIVMVFRRTRKRAGAGVSGGPPIGLPSFRLDDECDRAASLIRRLTISDEDNIEPDAWDEIYHDTKELLFGQKQTNDKKDSSMERQYDHQRANSGDFDAYHTADLSIPQDTFEAKSSAKIDRVKQGIRGKEKGSRRDDDVDDVEASTIRGMVQNSVGLAFVRISKLVVGVSVHGGSGIVIARLPDGTWSAPSAIGVFGGGLGVQVGMEVSDYILILQTQSALNHFRRGGNFTIGGNVGCAFAGIGRDALGAASIQGSCMPASADGLVVDDDTLDAANSSEIAPLVAYAKSQGLYIGVSLEGSRIFTRNDINDRTYKFITGGNVTAKDILGGKITTPPEAEGLYASLHSLEFDHEVSTLPHPPEMLRKDISNEWRYDRSNFTTRTGSSPFSFLSSINDEDAEELAGFETKFKKFLYGGVSVQRLVPDAELVNGTTRRERRTLWLMLPEVGSLRLGYISKVDDGAASPTHSRRGENPNNLYRRRESYENDDEYSYDYSEALSTGASTFVTEDSGLYTGYTEDYTVDDTMDGSIVSRQKNVRLSSKHSLALTGVVCLSQEPKVSIRFSVDDTTEHLRVINIEDESGANLLFLANNLREAELLTCGLKLLLERETTRLGLRGGVPLNKLGRPEGDKHHLNQPSPMPQPRDRSAHRPENRDQYSVSSEDMSENDDSIFTRESEAVSRQSWSKPQRRDYSAPDQTSLKSNRSEGSRHSEHINQYQDAEYDTKNAQKYVFGKEIIEEVASKVMLPLPLPLCRVLLLDSSSPVVMQWETARGDRNFAKGSWTFPPGNPREKQHYDSEHQLIAKGSLTGAHRTISFDRRRNGSVVRLSETLIVDTDSPEKVAMNIVERMPRRGFAIKIRLFLRAKSPHSCLATVLGEIRPMGKDLSDQAAVHRAFGMVRDEITARYGMDGGLLGVFVNLIKTLPSAASGGRKTPPRDNGPVTGNIERNSDAPVNLSAQTSTRQSSQGVNMKTRNARIDPLNKEDVPLQDLLKAKRAAQQQQPQQRSPTRQPQTPPRPSTPSFRASNRPNASKKSPTASMRNSFDPGDDRDGIIEVKPLPKIRLSLMPSPREVDEDESSQEASGRNTPLAQAHTRGGLNSTKKVTEWATEDDYAGNQRERRRKNKI